MGTDSTARSESLSQGHTPAPWEIDSQGLVFHRLDPLTKYVIAQMESGIKENELLMLAAPDLLDANIDAVEAILDLQSALHDTLHIIDYMRCSGDTALPLSGPSKLARANQILRSGALDKPRAAIAKAIDGAK